MLSSQEINSYAEALFSIGCEKQSLSTWYGQVKELYKIFSENQNFITLLRNRWIGAGERKGILENVFNKENGPRDFDADLINFLKVLIDNNDFFLILSIFDRFLNLIDHKNSVKFLKIYTAMSLSDHELKALISALKKSIDCEISVKTIVDSSLIAGVKIIADSFIIDGSLKGKMNQIFKKILTSRLPDRVTITTGGDSTDGN